MMSYLWILLLGSLLASHAKAQDDAAPPSDDEVPAVEADAEEETVPDPAEEPEQAETEAEVTEQDQVGGDAEPETTEGDTEAADPAAADPAAADPAAADPAAADPAAADPAEADPAAADPASEEETADGDAPVEAVEPASSKEETAEDTPAVAVDPNPSTEETVEAEVAADAEVETTKDEDAEAGTPAGQPEVDVAPADDDAEAVIPPVDSDAEGSTVITPVADPAAQDPATENEEVETPGSTDAPPVEDDNGADGQITPAADAGVDNNDDAPTAGSPIEPTIQGNVAPPHINPDLGFNLEDALSGSAEETQEKKAPSSRSANSGSPDKSEGDKPKAKEGGSGSLAGILSGIIVSAVGAVTGYFAYQKKKLCFKNRQDADPEAARKADAAEAQSDPQALNTLLNSS
ncbi:serine-aspartate repeat-containing protein I [Cololabis saira]|uniref:serine-aspartate repeat-containing protein I n=1 Tax=Cololabis saira TaxID=129043 RepID=UPI002AD4361C|nr:serine-aspartate repeat-containing protein I [Cololabis saira]